MKIFNRISAVVAVVAAIWAGAGAQNVTTPYSMYGYGILGDNATSMQRQMGGVGFAMNNGRQINAMNPASYAAIDSLTFLFDLGADVSMLWQKEGSAKERSVGGGLDYITMQFPICKYMGGSIGLLPYSSVGYAFGNEIRHGTRENQGTGGINQAYLGLSGRYAGVALGFNISYNFGNITNDVYSMPESSGRTLFEHVMKVRDWNIVVGAQYTARLSKDSRLTLGLTYSPKKTLLGTSQATVQELSMESGPDTVGFMNLKGKYYQPHSYGVGLNYTYEKAYRLMIEADFAFQQWSKAKYSAMYADPDPKNPNADPKVIFDGMNFNNRVRYALGAEVVPRLRGNYGQRISYRIGGFYTHDYLRIKGNSLREYGVGCGVGLPTPEGKTIINLGVEWRHRDAYPQNLISENYLNVTLGVNFNELWFWKRKIK